MKILKFSDNLFQKEIDQLCQRSAFSRDVDNHVDEILEDVRENGDKALIANALKFDGVNLTPEEFRVTEDEIDEGARQLDSVSIAAIDFAHDNILAFSSKNLPKTWSFSPRAGVNVGERFEPLSRVAAYIPGGSAPLVSTVIHTITMAKAAGVPEIVMTTPVNRSKKVHPAMLYAARLTGATEIYRLGGVHAIAAMAFGTESVRPVTKIIGPGNAYVTAAKRKVYGQVAVDLVAGPSEVVVIADVSANPVFIAADILAQAEHGSGHEQAVLITTSQEIIDAVGDEIKIQRQRLLRRDIIETVIRRGVTFILVRDLKQAAAVANQYAPEHLEIMTKNPDYVATSITTAGAIFIGQWTPEPVGDFVAGPSHVLPTGGSARFFSGLTVGHFFRRISQVKYDRDALERERQKIIKLSELEMLDAHGRSISVRFED